MPGLSGPQLKPKAYYVVQAIAGPATVVNGFLYAWIVNSAWVKIFVVLVYARCYHLWLKYKEDEPPRGKRQKVGRFARGRVVFD